MQGAGQANGSENIENYLKALQTVQKHKSDTTTLRFDTTKGEVMVDSSVLTRLGNLGQKLFGDKENTCQRLEDQIKQHFSSADSSLTSEVTAEQAKASKLFEKALKQVSGEGKVAKVKQEKEIEQYREEKVSQPKSYGKLTTFWRAITLKKGEQEEVIIKSGFKPEEITALSSILVEGGEHRKSEVLRKSPAMAKLVEYQEELKSKDLENMSAFERKACLDKLKSLQKAAENSVKTEHYRTQIHTLSECRQDLLKGARVRPRFNEETGEVAIDRGLMVGLKNLFFSATKELARVQGQVSSFHSIGASAMENQLAAASQVMQQCHSEMVRELGELQKEKTKLVTELQGKLSQEERLQKERSFTNLTDFINLTEGSLRTLEINNLPSGPEAAGLMLLRLKTIREQGGYRSVPLIKAPLDAAIEKMETLNNLADSK